MSIPPPKNISLLSKDISLYLSPVTASKTHPVPFPPVNEIFLTDSISKSCWSMRTFSTEPDKIGSASACSPELLSIIIFGGLIMS